MIFIKFFQIYYGYQTTSQQELYDCQPTESHETSRISTNFPSVHKKLQQLLRLIKKADSIATPANRTQPLSSSLQRPVLPRRTIGHGSVLIQTLTNCLMLFLHIVVIAATTLPASVSALGKLRIPYNTYIDSGLVNIAYRLYKLQYWKIIHSVFENQSNFPIVENTSISILSF